MTTTATITAHGFTGFLGKGLSLRELQCVLGIAAGRTSKELARDLGIVARREIWRGFAQ
ncbi:hypothetical protein [Pseudomonas aeruginosa]|uniref:hypothetical protein n=1 Tax=Pseudomonas aeruginosa TaxID=287 RepID=UPI00300416F8